jgi:hypothetical protein
MAEGNTGKITFSLMISGELYPEQIKIICELLGQTGLAESLTVELNSNKPDVEAMSIYKPEYVDYVDDGEGDIVATLRDTRLVRIQNELGIKGGLAVRAFNALKYANRWGFDDYCLRVEDGGAINLDKLAPVLDERQARGGRHHEYLDPIPNLGSASIWFLTKALEFVRTQPAEA